MVGRICERTENVAKLKSIWDSLSADLPWKGIGGVNAKIWLKCPAHKGIAGWVTPARETLKAPDIVLPTRMEISESHRELREQRINVNTETRSLRKRAENRNTNSRKSCCDNSFESQLHGCRLISLSMIRLFPISYPISSVSCLCKFS